MEKQKTKSSFLFFSCSRIENARAEKMENLQGGQEERAQYRDDLSRPRRKISETKNVKKKKSKFGSARKAGPDPANDARGAFLPGCSTAA